MERGMIIMNLVQVFSYMRGSYKQLKRVEFVSDMMSYIILSGCWCDIVLNVHAATQNKTDDMKDRFYEELEHVFDKFPKYHMQILLG
jgi:hypothetical protein